MPEYPISKTDAEGNTGMYFGSAMRRLAFHKNKGADQLCSNCTADQRLCFCFTYSTIPLLLKSYTSIKHLNIFRESCFMSDLVFSYHSSYQSYIRSELAVIFEPVHEKTNNLSFRPGPTQTRLYSHRKELEA